MDELIQIALFILFALFSLGSNLLNKRKKQQAETRKSREETELDTQRPTRRREVSSPDAPEERKRQSSTFEDILRELSGESPRRKPQTKVEEIEDDYEHPFASPKAKEKVEKAKQQAEQKAESFGRYTEQVKKKTEQVVQRWDAPRGDAQRGDAQQARRISDKISIEDSSKVKKLEVKTGKSKAKNKHLARSIAASLRDGQSARKAIILSEIINRKHF